MQRLVSGDDNCAFLRTRDNRKWTILADGFHSFIKRLGLIKRFCLVFVRKNDIDSALTHQIEKLFAITVYAEWIRQGHGNLTAMLMRDLGSENNGFLGAWRVPKIAFEIGDASVGNLGGFDVFGSKFDAGTQIGIH